MSRFAVRIVFFALGVAVLPGSGAAQPRKFEHVVIIVQENRTPDNLFHGLQRVLPRADIADTGFNSIGETIALEPLPLAVPFDLGHLHADFVAMYDSGRMDGADRVWCGGECPANPPFHFVRYADIAPYFAIAIDYGFANRMFQTNQGPSFPAHQFLLGGTSQPSPFSPLFAAENVLKTGAAGCIAPPDQRVPMIDPNGNEGVEFYPCFEHQTLAGRYYTPDAASIWTAPNAIQHLCGPAANPPRCTAPPWTAGDVVTWPAQILVDIDQRALRGVSWVVPTGQDSDHAFSNDGSGPSWVASIVNAVGQSSYWNNTAVLITWDDWGGWYDHVAPPIDPTYGYYQLGFRVPLLVVSAYTPAGYVSDQRHDFGSILRFVETVFDLGRIPPGNFADARADDLFDFFDFSRPARAFVPIGITVPKGRFLDWTRPMLPPDTD
jgi:phospholipase C